MGNGITIVLLGSVKTYPSVVDVIDVNNRDIRVTVCIDFIIV